MKARIEKWGSTLALRIPESYAEQAGLEPEAVVDVSLAGRTLVVRRLPQEPATLDQLLEGVTPQNLHGEQALGPAVGGEAW